MSSTSESKPIKLIIKPIAKGVVKEKGKDAKMTSLELARKLKQQGK